jgi:hypothetical protein
MYAPSRHRLGVQRYLAGEARLGQIQTNSRAAKVISAIAADRAGCPISF